MASTLYEFYTSQGKPLPSISTRAQLYEQLGLGSASSYQGTASQNTKLLQVLQTQTPTSSTTQASTTPTAPPPDWDALKALGLSEDTINSLSENDRIMFETIGKVIQTQIEQGNPPPPIFTTTDLDKILQDAQNDPQINQYYKDQALMGKQDFLNTIGSETGEYNQTRAKQEADFVQAKKDLAEREAAAGRAYSGFRTQAEQRLATDQAGIVESTRRTMQQNLNAAGSAFEKNYGSTALRAAGVPSVDGLSYNPYSATLGHDVAGINERNKQADIVDAQQEALATASLSRGLTGPATPSSTPTTTIPSTTPTSSTPTPSTNYGAYVPDPKFLKYYTENQIIRSPDGKIYLQPGVPIKW